MADIIDQKIPHEILIRFSEDGVPQGAHVCWRRVVRLGEEVLKDEPLPAEPLVLDADFPTSGLLSDVTATALAEVGALRVELAAQRAETAAARADLQALLRAVEAKAPVPGEPAEAE